MARPKGRREQPEKARNTATPKKETKGSSPTWYVALMFGLMVIGGLIIILNYMGLLGDTSNWYLLIGLVAIGAGFMMTLNFR